MALLIYQVKLIELLSLKRALMSWPDVKLPPQLLKHLPNCPANLSCAGSKTVCQIALPSCQVKLLKLSNDPVSQQVKFLKLPVKWPCQFAKRSSLNCLPNCPANLVQLLNGSTNCQMKLVMTLPTCQVKLLKVKLPDKWRCKSAIA